MIKITGVYVRKDGLYLLYCGEDAVALLDYKAIEQHNISTNCVIDRQTLEEIIYHSDCRRCKAKALDLLSRRDYCQKELLSRLNRDFDEDSAQFAVESCLTAGFVNDERYANNAAISLISNKHYSPYRAVRELKNKGVDAAIAQEAVDSALSLIEYDELEEICTIIKKKYPRFDEDEKINRRCFNYLARLGYSPHDIFAAMDELKEDYFEE